MHEFFQHFRYALRRLRKDPSFTAIAVLTLALGIGANTAIFSIVNAVLLRPLPYRDPQSLVLLAESWPQFPRLSVSYLNYRDFRSQSHSFEAVGAVRNSQMTLSGTAEAERIPTQNVTSNLFAILGATPELGRGFFNAEDEAGGAAVAIIGHQLWERRFSSSQSVLGQPITLDNRSYSIVGVMPAGFKILDQAADVLLPLEPWAKTLSDDRGWHPGILPIARLKSGVSLDHARSEMNVIAAGLEKEYPTSNTGVKALVDPIQDQLVANVRPALLVLIGAVGFVLLIACANVANLVLVRAAGRRREMAVRTALGARRSDIIRQLLSESILVAIIGGGVGLLLARLAMPSVIQLAGSSLPRTDGITLDSTVLEFTAAIALIAGILFGLAPARHAWRVDLREAIGDINRGGSAPAVLRTRAALIVSEIALAVLLLAGAGLLLKSFERLANVSPGFRSDHILVANVVRSPSAYPDRNVRLAFFDRLFEQVAALPGVRSAGGISVLPVTGTGSILQFHIQGRRPPRSPAEYSIANYRQVNGGYLKTMGIPLMAGRWIEDSDREGTSNVVVVNSAFARAFFPTQSPLGQHLQISAAPDASIPWMEIVGVTGDVKASLSSGPSAEMYVPYRQSDQTVFRMSLVVRTLSDPLTMVNSVRGIARRIDVNQPITEMRSMDESMAESISQPRFRTVLLAIFAGIALVLAGIGIFGVMAYSVTQRTRELGVRMALGASRAQVLKLVLIQGIRLTVIGIAMGLSATLLVTRYLSSLLFNLPAYDPLTLAAVSVGLFVISMGACYFPARRATMVDPMEALRPE